MASSRTIENLRRLMDRPDARGVIEKYVANPLDSSAARATRELIYSHVTSDGAETIFVLRSVSGFFRDR